MRVFERELLLNNQIHQAQKEKPQGFFQVVRAEPREVSLGSSGSERRGSRLNCTGRVARNEREPLERGVRREAKDGVFKWGERLRKEGGFVVSVLFQVNTTGNLIPLC